MSSSTLRPCSVGLGSSSGLLMTSRLPRSSTLPLARGPDGRNSLKLINPRSCQAHGGGVVHARTDMDYVKRFNSSEMDYEFLEEGERIEKCFKKIINAGDLRSEGTMLRVYVCRIAKDSLRLASVIMGKPADISADTLLSKLMTPKKTRNMVLQVCVGTFVSTAEDAYDDKITKETMVSFLLALERLAAVSYFMAQDTMANLRDFDIDRDRFEYMKKMTTLKHDLNMAQAMMLVYTVSDAMILTERFVISMTTSRINAVRSLMPAIGGATTV